jgi:hypothetical protein
LMIALFIEQAEMVGRLQNYILESWAAAAFS